MKFRWILVIVPLLVIGSCQEPVVVKPAALLRLDYPLPNYAPVGSDCAFTFYKNDWAQLSIKNGCNMTLDYPQMKAALYLTYLPVTENLNQLISDAQKRTYDHTVRATDIIEQALVDPVRRVYGMYYAINGEAATQAQFYVTDSTRHFVAGALYFKTKPNFDSLYPAIDYIREDIKTLMETVIWTP